LCPFFLKQIFAAKEKLEIVKERGEPQITGACFRPELVEGRKMFELL